MENLIGKELLCQVLKVDIRKINNSTLDGNLYYYKSFVKCKSKINIYELAHKCKEWAIGEHGLSLHSFPCHDDTYTCEIYKFHKSTGYVIVDWFNCLSENKAIFESCEWILKND